MPPEQTSGDCPRCGNGPCQQAEGPCPRYPDAEPYSTDNFEPGRYVMADTDARGARDGAGLLQQAKFMRDGMHAAGHAPGLILVLVADDERKAAVERIRKALDA